MKLDLVSDDYTHMREMHPLLARKTVRSAGSGFEVRITECLEPLSLKGGPWS